MKKSIIAFSFKVDTDSIFALDREEVKASLNEVSANTDDIP
jgi:hypothetical protein